MIFTYENAVQWFEHEFRQSPRYARMAETVESSPWHREANVGVHTDMVVGEYSNLANTAQYDDAKKAMGLLATAFHDVGKPAAKTEKYHEDRGNYLSFHGHEKISAVDFIDYVTSGQLSLTIDNNCLFNIAWMIENHMPWTITNPAKLAAIHQTAAYGPGIDVYCDVLLADQYGRIADDQQSKNARANQWISNFRAIPHATKRVVNDQQRVLTVLIGPSGAGKTTFVQSIPGEKSTFSLDALRLQWYDNENYANAFAMSTEDKGFYSKANHVFSTMLNTDHHIIVDNTNMTRKSRSTYINSARQRGFFINAVWFATPLQVMIDRQQTRGDKTVPTDAVIRQFNNLELPMLGEVDDIAVVRYQ